MLDAHGGLRSEDGGDGANERGSGGSDEFAFEVGGVGGKVAQEICGGGCGDREAAVRAVHHAAAEVERGGEPLVDIECVDAGGGGDDVDDGIDRTYFMEVDFFDGHVVDLCFGGAEELEGLNSGLFYGGCERSGVDEVADDAKGSAVGVVVFVGVAGLVLVLRLWVVLMGVSLLMRLIILVIVGVGLRFLSEGSALVHVHLGAGDAAAIDSFDFECGVEMEGSGCFVEDRWIDSGVYEGSEEHVAADAGEAVEVGDTHELIVSCAVGIRMAGRSRFLSDERGE